MTAHGSVHPINKKKEEKGEERRRNSNLHFSRTSHDPQHTQPG
jgi:hypothetical protein